MDQELRDIITSEVRNYLRNGGKIKDISQRTGLSRSTITRITYGDTRRPQLHTVVALLTFFGYRLVAEKLKPHERRRPYARSMLRTTVLGGGRATQH